MATCTGCHARAIGLPQRPALAIPRDTVTATFSHPAHAARSPAGKDCLQCHADVRAADDSALPRPTMQTCATASCHDGKAAFATTVACTRCHAKAPDRFEVARPTSRFLHVGFHAEAVANRPCGACHALGPRGDTLVASHDACVECHAKDFAARRPQICGACHNATEPWRALVPDRAPADRTEFGATLDHTKHTQDCKRCHTLRTRSAQLRPARGHASCTGAGCHASKSGPAPTLETCAGCHRAGLAAAREQARLRAPWSVRASFDHSTHTKDGEAKPLPCTSCHTTLPGADLVSLPTPAKGRCAPCHDAGKSAFKLTGTTCSRCHREGAR
jgi:c(7)-type cytochrome triheme protein